MIRQAILLKSVYTIFFLLSVLQTNAASSSSVEPATVPLNPPVQSPAAAREKAPTIPLSPPVKANEVAAPSVVKVPPPAPPTKVTPDGFVSTSNNCKMSKTGDNVGPDAVAGDSTSGKGSSSKGGGNSGKGDGDSAGDSSTAADDSGKAGGANRYHQRRRTRKETKGHRKLHSPTNATKTTGAEGDGVKADTLGSDGCDETQTQTDALSVDSGAMREGTLLWALMFFLAGCPFLLL
jgi:hypothetical protein